jgi:Mlc titration factor MtfA (ptsG expression regulator)/Tfp pilus assembly protein PilF
MVFSWFTKQRRNRLLAEPVPPAWQEYLTKNVRHYEHLTAQEQLRVCQIAQILFAEKDWVGGAGFEVTVEIKVTVAGQAAVLALGLEEPYYFDAAQTIIVYPGPYRHPAMFRNRNGIVRDGTPVSGESWYRGPIVLSWSEVLAGGRNQNDGHNVVFHEFAHYVDALDGEVDGTPPLVGREQQRTWFRVTEAEYLRLVGKARRDEVSLLDHYGATNRAEFFAVATECFFELPSALLRQHRDLYHVLSSFYRQDPSRWLPDATVAVAEERAARPDSRAAKLRKHRQHRLAVLRSDNLEALFTLAIAYFNEERYGLAAGAATRVIRLDPDDGEAYQHRAMSRVNLRHYAAALADAEEALDCDPEDDDSYLARGAAYVGLGEFAKAKTDLDRVIKNRDDAETRYYRGRAWMGLGDPRRAAEDFARSLAASPFAAEVYYHSGLAQQALGNTDDAKAYLAKAFQLDPRVDRRA